MTDTELIFLILAVFYLVECCAWIPLTANVLSGWWKRLGLRKPIPLSASSTGLSFCNPLPFARSHAIAEWPVVLSPEGIAVTFESGTDDQTNTQPFIGFNELKKISQQDKLLLINGRSLKTPSADAAKHCCQFLQTVIEASEAKRKHLIAEELDAYCNLEAAKERAMSVREDSASVRMTATMLFGLLFIYGPYLYYKNDGPWSEALLMRFLLVFVTTWLMTIVVFWLTTGRTTNASRGERTKRSAMMLFSPAMAMRSGDYALRGSLHRFHPVIATVACGSQLTADEFAADRIRRLKLQPIRSSVDVSPEYKQAVEWNAAETHKRLIEQLETANFEPAKWFQPPDQDPDANSFCPLCRDQYTMTEGCCETCDGFVLQSFETTD